MKSLSFREMSALGSALAVALIACLYFPEALRLASTTLYETLSDGRVQEMDKIPFLFRYAVGIIVLLVVLQVIYHILIGILWRREAMERRDERDRLVSLKAGRVSYLVLVTGLCILFWCFLVGNVSNFLAAEYSLMLLFAGEFARYCATFVYYRLSV